MAVTQGVPAACFAEALEQGVSFTGQEQYFAFDFLCLQLIENLIEVLQALGQVTCINARSSVFNGVWCQLEFLGQCIQQTGGQVINTVITQVFQCMQSNTFSRAGKSADNNQFQNSSPLTECRSLLFTTKITGATKLLMGKVLTILHETCLAFHKQFG
jgi:hypothetical protein